MVLKSIAAAVLFVAGLAAPALAASTDDLNIFSIEATFEDVAADVEDAIVNRGYGVDYHGRIGAMLKRTAADVGATKALYQDAEFFQFCSAVLSRKMMEAEPHNISYCPFVVAVYELASKPGTVYVSYRRPGAGSTQASRQALATIDKLLEDISRDATQ
ncbi:MAG: DUF302 domain-containing protein [Alphaproteobacteria bacterium]